MVKLTLSAFNAVVTTKLIVCIVVIQALQAKEVLALHFNFPFFIRLIGYNCKKGVCMEQAEIVKRLTGLLLPLIDDSSDPENSWVIKEIVCLIKDISGRQIIVGEHGFSIPP